MRVLRRALIAVPLAVLPPVTAPASGETLGDARVGFSAERVLVINGQSYVGKMWHMPGEQRHDQNLPAIKPIFILRADSAIGSLWLSAEGIPMRCDAQFRADKGKVSVIRWELHHVKIGQQDAALFEIPRGYAKLPPEAAAPLLGMRLGRPPAH